MKPIIKTVFFAAAIAVALCVTSCSWFSSKPAHISAAKVAEARQYIKNQAVYNPADDTPVSFRVFGTGNSYIKAISITPRKIKIVTKTPIAAAGNIFVFPLKYLTPGSGCDDVTCLANIYQQGDIDIGNYFDYEFYLPKNNGPDTPDAVYKLAYALTVLKQAALQDRSSDPAFEHIASEYRHQTPKPTLPEEAEHLKTQAESAEKDKKFDNAADDYAEALDMAPWWPEGHRSLALSLAELNDYRGAIDEMQCYLLLVPVASDEKASQDKIKGWEKKTALRKS